MRDVEAHHQKRHRGNRLIPSKPTLFATFIAVGDIETSAPIPSTARNVLSMTALRNSQRLSIALLQHVLDHNAARLEVMSGMIGRLLHTLA